MANARTEGHKMAIFSLSNLTELGYNSARELCFLIKLFCEFWDVAEAVFYFVSYHFVDSVRFTTSVMIISRSRIESELSLCKIKTK